MRVSTLRTHEIAARKLILWYGERGGCNYIFMSKLFLDGCLGIFRQISLDIKIRGLGKGKRSLHILTTFEPFCFSFKLVVFAGDNKTNGNQ